MSAIRIAPWAVLLFVLSGVSYLHAQGTGARQPQAGRQVQAQAGRGNAAGVQQGRMAGPPPGFQLSAAQQQRIDKMLSYWEQQSGRVKTFQADFVRWLYDPNFGPKNPNQAARITGGEVRYAAPSQGMIKETRIAKFDSAKAKAGDKWPYAEQKNAVGEHWVCDGKSVFEFAHNTKQLIQTKLPPEMQGKAIANGPLPFMFGAKAETLKKRYWIREIPQKKEKNAPYHLELVPKGRGEDFSLARVRLDAKEFMPEVLEVHDLGQGRSVYQFSNRKVNNVGSVMRNFANSFVSPRTPAGWTKITHDGSGSSSARQAAGQPPATRR